MATTKKFGHSVAGVYLLPVNADGSAPSLDEFLQNGIKVADISDISDNSDKPEYQEIKAKETKRTITSLLTSEGTQKFTLEVFDLSDKNLSLFLGSTSNGYGTNVMPTQPVKLFKSLCIIQQPVDGISIVRIYPKVEISSHLANDFADDNIDRIVAEITVVNPVDAAGVEQPAEYILYVPAAPTITEVDTSANTLDFEFVTPHFNEATDYEYTTDAGATWNDVTAKPVSDTAITTGKPANTFGVRVKRSATYKVEAGLVGWYPYAT